MRVYYSRLLKQVDLEGMEVIIYRATIPKRSLRHRKYEAGEILCNALNHNWQTAKELSIKTGIRFHQAVKLLQIVMQTHDIEVKHIEWIDGKRRHRGYTMYRKRKDMASIYNAILGFKPHPVAAGVVHKCKDE